MIQSNQSNQTPYDLNDLLKEIVMIESGEEWNLKRKYPLKVVLESSCQSLVLGLISYAKNHPESIQELKGMIRLSYLSKDSYVQNENCSNCSNYMIQNVPTYLFHSHSAFLRLWKCGINISEKRGAPSFSLVSAEDMYEFIRLFNIDSVDVIQLGLSRNPSEKFFERFTTSQILEQLKNFLNYLYNQKIRAYNLDKYLLMLIQTPTLLECFSQDSKLQTKIQLLFDFLPLDQFYRLKHKSVSCAKDCQRSFIIDLMSFSKNYPKIQKESSEFIEANRLCMNHDKFE